MTFNVISSVQFNLQFITIRIYAFGPLKNKQFTRTIVVNTLLQNMYIVENVFDLLRQYNMDRPTDSSINFKEIYCIGSENSALQQVTLDHS
jgi:hypothetical protein